MVLTRSLKDARLRTRFFVVLAALSLTVLPGVLACGPKPPGMTLLDAIAEGRVEIVRDHISSGADPNKAFIPPGLPAAGASALHLAVISDNREIAEILLEGGAEIDIAARDPFHGPPLEWAAFYGIKDMVVLLVDSGAGLNAKNAFGTTPLDAAYADNPFIPKEGLQELNENRDFVREDLNAAGGKRSNPKLTLLEAIDREDLDAVHSLLDSGAYPNQAFIPPGLPAAGASALHLAVLKNEREIARVLLDNGADIDIRAKDEARGTPLEWAAFFGIRDMVIFLVEAGADLNAKNAFGTTPLDAASADNPFISEKDLAQFNEDRAFIGEYLSSKSVSKKGVLFPLGVWTGGS